MGSSSCLSSLNINGLPFGQTGGTESITNTRYQLGWSISKWKNQQEQMIWKIEEEMLGKQQKWA